MKPLIERILQYMQKEWPGEYSLVEDNNFQGRYSIHFQSAPFVTVYNSTPGILYVNRGNGYSTMISWSMSDPESNYPKLLDYWKVFIRSQLDSDLQYYMFLQSKKINHDPK